MICIDHDIDAPRCQFLFRELVVSGRHCHNRCMRILLTETLTEFLDILATLILGVDHHTIGTSCYISMTALQSIINRFAGNEALTTGYDHKVTCDLSILTGLNLIAEAFDGVLCLNGIRTKQGIYEP